MMTAVEKLADTRAAADIKSADALGCVELVAGERKEIDIQRVYVDGNFAGGLDSVRVEINLVLFGDAADFFQRVNGAELVVGVHHGDENGFRADRALEGLPIDKPFAADRQVCEGHTVLFRRLARIQNGFVFNGGGDCMWSGMGGGRTHSQDWLCHKRAEDAEDGVIVGFGAAAGEDDFLRLSADECSHLFAGGFDGGAGALAGRVDRGGVGEVGGEIGEHGVEDLGVDGRRGVVIEVDVVHGLCLSILRPAKVEAGEAGIEGTPAPVFL